MSDANDPLDLIPLVATPAFFPSILAYIQEAAPAPLPLDPVIFKAILLCLIAGDKHLILQTPEEDVGLVTKLAVWTLSSVFDLSSHRVKIKSKSPCPHETNVSHQIDTSRFLRSLFLRLNDEAGDDATGAAHGKTPEARPRSAQSAYLHPSYRRSASFPDGISFPPASLDPHTPHTDTEHQPLLASRHPRDIGCEPSDFRAVSPQSSSHGGYHSHTEPRHRTTRIEFPRALVFSGLEHAHEAEQRQLARVVADRRFVIEGNSQNTGNATRISRSRYAKRRRDLPERPSTSDSDYFLGDADYEGTWHLPDGFLMIYVSPWDARERPKIHRSLLDRFALSTVIIVRENIRQILRMLPFTHHNSTPRNRLRTVSTLAPPTFPSVTPPRSKTPPHPSHSFFSQSQQPHHAHLRHHSLHQPHPHPHHHHHRHSHAIPVSILPRRVLPAEFFSALKEAYQQVYMASTLSLYLSDVFTAVRHHNQLDGTFLTARAFRDAEALVRAERVIGTDPTGGELVREVPEYNDTLRDYESLRSESKSKNGGGGKAGDGTAVDDESRVGESQGITIHIVREPSSDVVADDRLGTADRRSSDMGRDAPRKSSERERDALARDRGGREAESESVLRRRRPFLLSSASLFVTEADIARIVPRVVTHRLRVRDGPEHEVLASAVFGAAFDVPAGSGSGGADESGQSRAGAQDTAWDARNTIKDILVGILSDV